LIAKYALRGSLATFALASLVVFGSLLSLASSRARAEEGPYSNFLVGERSLGLGGAFVAVADDTSSIFHNPSGLASLGTSSYSGSLWAVIRRTREIQSGYRTDLGTASLDQGRSLSLPSFLGGVVKLGRKQKDKVRPHALAFALFTPHAEEYRFVQQLEEPEAADRIEVRHEDRSRWAGVAYAYRLRPGFAIGLGLFAAQRSLQHDEVELRGREPMGMAPTGNGYSRASTLAISDYKGMARLGLHVDLAKELRAGLMFQPPGLQLGGSAKAEYLQLGFMPDDTTIDVVREDDLAHNLPTPWEMRFGVAWLSSTDLVSLDLSLVGPAGDKGDPLPMLETDDPGFGLFVPKVGYRRVSLRGAIGFEVALTSFMPLRGGIFFERSSAPPVLATSDVYVREHSDQVGGSLSLGLRIGSYDLAMGATAWLGRGEGLAIIRGSGFEDPVAYRSADVEDTLLMVFVSGGKRAVRELVKSTFD